MIENIINNIASATLDMLNIVFVYVVLFGAKINKDKKRIIISYFAGIVSLIAGMLFIDSFDLYFTKVYWLIIPICWFTSRKKKWFALYPFIYNGTSIINICFSYVVAIVMNTSDAVVVVGGLGRLISESICVVILLIILVYHKIRHIKVLEVMLSWQQYLVMFIGVFCAIILVGSVQWMTLGEKLPQIALNLYGFVVTIICLIFFVICL